MYVPLLAIHNILRWLALLAAIFALARAILGWLGNRPWQALDRMAGVIFTSLLDIQLLLGLALYVFFSPLTTGAFRNFDFGNVMKNSGVRFFVVEHISLMILAIVFAHIGSIAAKKAPAALQKHKRAALWFALALVAILAAIPWDAVRLLPRF